MAKRKAFLILLVFLMAIALSSCKAILDDLVEQGNVYTVYISPNGGIWGDTGTNETISQQVKHGGYLQYPGDVERFGYDFAGWKISTSQMYYDFNSPSPVTMNNIHILADWAPVTKDGDVGGIKLKLQYDDSENNGLKIIGYVGPAGDFSIEIPEEFHFIDQHYPVVSIASNAFKYNSNSTNFSSIVLPESIVEIETKAFHDCCTVNEIHIPSSVTKMGSEVFYPHEYWKEMTVYLPFGENDVPSGWASDWNYYKNVTYVYQGDDTTPLR